MSDKPQAPNAKPAEPGEKAVKHPPKPPRNPFSRQTVDRKRARNDHHARDVRHK